MITRSISQYQPSQTPPPPVSPPSSPPPVTTSAPAPLSISTRKVTPIPTTTSPYLSPPPIDENTPPATGHPRTVIAQTPSTSSTLGSMAQKVVQELQETPYVDTQVLNQESAEVKWRTAAIVSVAAFFLGAFLSMVAMFWLY